MFVAFAVGSAFRLFWRCSGKLFACSIEGSVGFECISGAGSGSCCAVAGSGTSVVACGCWSLICGDCESLGDCFFLICLKTHFLAASCCCFAVSRVGRSCWLGCCRGRGRLFGFELSGSRFVDFGWLGSRNFDLFEGWFVD